MPIDTTNISKQYIPTGVRFGLDLLGPALYLVDNRTLSYELTAETDISNFGIMLEAGHQEFAETNENVEYLMKGNFLRVGPEVNFLASDKQLNSFSLGLRYAWSSFSETVWLEFFACSRTRLIICFHSTSSVSFSFSPSGETRNHQ